jgi:hypothetical protein
MADQRHRSNHSDGSCPQCGSHLVEIVEAKSFQLSITHDHQCLACGAVWRPATAPWLCLGGGVVLCALGGWKLAEHISQRSLCIG